MTSDPNGSHRGRSRRRRAARSLLGGGPDAVVFAVAIVAAVPVIMYLNRTQWFFLDEWDYLATRSLTSPDDLFRSHNGHWATVPVVVYRVLFQIVGLNHYWPYQAVLVVAHLAVAVLIRAVARRAGADPWVATAAGVLFAYFGAGRVNIAWGFQIGFVAAVLFGLCHLVLADHDGPWSRRDLLGLAFGVAALLSHGPGVAMAMGTGVSVLLRRGWRMAALHVVPLAALFATWYVVVAPPAVAVQPTVSQWIAFVGGMYRSAAVALTQWAPAAVVLVVAATVGLGALLAECRGVVRRTAAPLAGLLVAALGFAGTTALGRAALNFDEGSGASRYVHVLAALLLPVIAVGLSGLARRYRPAAVVAVALLVVGLPANVRALEPTGADLYTVGRPDHWSQLAALALADVLDPALHPEPFEAEGVTLGWLSEVARSGRIRVADEVPPDVIYNVELVQWLVVVEDADPPPSCEPLSAGTVVVLDRGDLVSVEANLVSVTRMVDWLSHGTALFLSSEGVDLSPTVDRLAVKLSEPATVCR